MTIELHQEASPWETQGEAEVWSVNGPYGLIRRWASSFYFAHYSSSTSTVVDTGHGWER